MVHAKEIGRISAFECENPIYELWFLSIRSQAFVHQSCREAATESRSWTGRHC